jgi:hypothetical protein
MVKFYNIYKNFEYMVRSVISNIYKSQIYDQIYNILIFMNVS